MTVISSTPACLRQVTNLDTWMAGFSSSIGPGQLYAEPSSDAVDSFIAGVTEIQSGLGTTDYISSLGFIVSSGHESVSRRPYVLAENELGTNRSWGAYLFDRSRSVRLLIEAPHPVFDQYTEKVGLSLWRAVPGSCLMIAGAHRDAANELADVAWQQGALFNKFAEAMMPIPQIQVHGFADSTAPNYDVVLASGSAPAGQMIRDIADAVEAADFRVGRVWEGVDVLTAVGNRQSKLSQAAGAEFVHMEINRTVRVSTELTNNLVSEVSSVLLRTVV